MTGGSIRLLHVDDDPDFADLVATFLEREDDAIAVETAASAAEGLDRLAGGSFDCVVSDHEMPGRNGIEFLEAVRADHPDLPFLLYTGKGSEAVASRAISAGVTDYLQKGGGTGQYAVLANRVRNAVEGYRAQRAAERTRSRLEAIAENSTDAILTVDGGSTVRFANPAVEDLFGYAPDDLVGSPLARLMPDRRRDGHRDAVARYLETGERTMDWHAVEFPARHRAGHEIPVSISFGEFERDGEQRFVGVVRDVSERVRMEEELRERERRFRQLAENVGEVVWMSDPEKSEMFYVNPAYEEIWGRSPETLYEDPTSFLDAIHPEDRPRVAAALDAQTDGGYDEEYRIVRPDGEVRWIHDRAVPVRDDDGEVYRIVGIASDVTEREESRRRLETLIDNLPGLVYRCRNEPGWPMADVRGECDALTGYAAAALEAGEVAWGEDVIHPDDRERTWRAVQGALDRDEPFEVTYRIVTADGTTKWVWERGRRVAFPDHDPTVLEGFVTDVTEYKDRERELRRYERILHTMDEAACIYDEDGRFEVVNEYLADFYGATREALEGEQSNLVPTIRADADGDPYRELLDGERSEIQGEVDGEFSGRGHEVLSYRLTPLVIDGSVEGVVGVAREVTEHRERERELERQNERLDEFTSVVSHDLRNPLNVAEGRLDLAREASDSEHLDDVARALDRMNDLIDDLLTLARDGVAVSDPDAVALGDLVDDCWRNVETGGATLVVDAEGAVLADRGRLTQLLENLFRNSVEHGSTGSRAGPGNAVEHGSTSNRTESGDSVGHGSTSSRAEPGDSVEHGGADVTVTVGDLDDGFYVADDGPGIPEERRSQVFDAGYSTAAEGTGFGLSIVHEVADAHDWTVAVTEGVDGGARFEITGVERPSDG